MQSNTCSLQISIVYTFYFLALDAEHKTHRALFNSWLTKPNLPVSLMQMQYPSPLSFWGIGKRQGLLSKETTQILSDEKLPKPLENIKKWNSWSLSPSKKWMPKMNMNSLWSLKPNFPGNMISRYPTTSKRTEPWALEQFKDDHLVPAHTPMWKAALTNNINKYLDDRISVARLRRNVPYYLVH